MEAHENLSVLDVGIKLEDYEPTDKLLLTFDTLHSNIQLIITKEQLEQLRMAIYRTNEEAEEEYQEAKKINPSL